MTLSATCNIVLVITEGACKAATSHLVYISNPCEIVITINYTN